MPDPESNLRYDTGIAPRRDRNMNRSFPVVIERDAGGYYVASVPALPGCHTQARSMDKLL